MSALVIIACIFTPVGIAAVLLGVGVLVSRAGKIEPQEASRDCEHVGHNWSTWEEGGGWTQVRTCRACGYLQRVPQMEDFE